MDQQSCILCQLTEKKDLILVSDESRQKLVESSMKRLDLKFKVIQKQEPIIVHKNCRTTYNRQSVIDKCRQSITRKSLDGKKILKDGKSFDFSTHCLFCSNDCTHEPKKNLRTTSNDSTKDNLVNYLVKDKKKKMKIKKYCLLG